MLNDNFTLKVSHLHFFLSISCIACQMLVFRIKPTEAFNLCLLNERFRVFTTRTGGGHRAKHTRTRGILRARPRLLSLLQQARPHIHRILIDIHIRVNSAAVNQPTTRAIALQHSRLPRYPDSYGCLYRLGWQTWLTSSDVWDSTTAFYVTDKYLIAVWGRRI